MNHEPSAGMPSFLAVRPPALRCAQARLLDVIYCVAGGAYHLVSGAGILIRLVRGLLAGASTEAASDGQQPGAGSWRGHAENPAGTYPGLSSGAGRTRSGDPRLASRGDRGPVPPASARPFPASPPLTANRLRRSGQLRNRQPAGSIVGPEHLRADGTGRHIQVRVGKRHIRGPRGKSRRQVPGPELPALAGPGQRPPGSPVQQDPAAGGLSQADGQGRPARRLPDIRSAGCRARSAPVS